MTFLYYESYRQVNSHTPLSNGMQAARIVVQKGTECRQKLLKNVTDWNQRGTAGMCGK